MQNHLLEFKIHCGLQESQRSIANLSSTVGRIFSGRTSQTSFEADIRMDLKKSTKACNDKIGKTLFFTDIHGSALPIKT